MQNKFIIIYIAGFKKKFLPVFAKDKKGASEHFYKKIDTCQIIEIEQITFNK